MVLGSQAGVLLDDELRRQLLMAFTEDNRLHVNEVARLLAMVQGEVDTRRLVADTAANLPQLARQLVVNWSDRVLAS